MHEVLTARRKDTSRDYMDVAQINQELARIAARRKPTPPDKL
jgi:hypothetical protein